MFLSKITNINILNFLDWIYKKKCYFCKSSKEAVKMCSNCYEKLVHLPVGVNRIYENVKIICAGNYNNELQKLIRGLKYHNQKDLAYFQAKFMYEYWKKYNFEGEFQVVAVPQHEKRNKKRHYNHMELVATEFCNLTGYNTNFELIKRIKDTKPQYKLTKKQREENLHNAFKTDKSKLKVGKILILDDICTTGSTFEEMIRELKRNEIEDIICFATTTPL